MKPTIVSFEGFNAAADAKTLHKACKGLGTDEKAIISILAFRSNRQRVEIAKSYKEQYGKDLDSMLRSELKGGLELLAVAAITPLYEFLARELHDAMAGIGTNEAALAEILGVSDNQTIHEINQAYEKLYGHPLEKDLKKDTSGCLERLLVIMSMGKRESGADQKQATLDAGRLWLGGEARLGTNEDAFVSVLGHRSHEHLRLVFDEYERIAGRSLPKAIEEEFSGSAESGMLYLVRAIDNPVKYFAHRLRDSMKGLGTKEKVLVRIVTWRSELDMGNIKEAYENKFDRKLADQIHDECHGGFRSMVTEMIA